MQAASLEILEKANVPAPQARAIVQAIEFELIAAKDTLATKHDIIELRQGMGELRHGLELKMEGVKTEVVRWVFLAVVGLIPIMSGVMYFLLQNTR